MERTLDSIRPSDVESTRDNMSYLYGRDPSILAYAERPLPCSKQNLISLYEDEEDEYTDDTGSDAITLQTVKVYLRVKPLPRKLKLTKEEAEAYQIANSTTLVTKLPSLDHNASGLKMPKTADTICRKFTFTKTFGPETTQLHLFEQVIQQKMVDFLGGQNSTVMTYGTTNSGKSYTLQGTTTSPGIIPRGLEFVFSNITTRATPSYKPIHNSDVICLNAVDRAQELECKNKILSFGSIDKHHYINAYKQMQKLLQEESPIRESQACDAQYSVWVSFAEIYNENIYDLLSNESQKRRQLLKLVTDNHGRAFIKGLKTICVNSGSEAYQVLMAGQSNLKVAATALNARSSRSHCIFTIKLLKYYVENAPERVEVSTFAFCDLAGSERLKKTLNVGDRLKEAQNINTSLLVLGRCLKSIYEGQTIKQKSINEHVGPFRESKLTRLFQRALSGKEQIALIVNVNPIPNLYVETQNVLNFSAIAKKIVVEPKQIKQRISNSRFSQIVAQSGKSCPDWDDTELSEITEQTVESCVDTSVFIHQDEYDDIVAENKSLKKEIGALKASMLNRDLQIRQELADTYTAMMKKLETDWKNRIRDVEEQQEDQLEWSVQRVETFYKQKISELTSRKRRRRSDDDSDEDVQDLGELQIENTRLTAKVQSLKKTMKNLRENNESVNAEKNKIAFELGLANEELKSVKSLLETAQDSLCNDDEERVYIDKLRSELSEKQAHIKKLKKFLDEAKDEYIAITDHAGMMENRLKVQAEELAECQENVADLEEMLESVKVCLAEKTASSELLEEKLSVQSNLLRDSKIREQSAQAKLTESEETIRRLREKLAVYEKTNISPESVTPDSMLADVEIKEEILSECESENSLENRKIAIPEGIVIKTDTEKIGIPVTNYENERESEMFVAVEEIGGNEKIDDKKNVNELKAQLRNFKIENESLKRKCEKSQVEIDSLRESFEAVKKRMGDVDKQLNEYKIASALEKNMELFHNSFPLKIGEPETSDDPVADVEFSENACQTASISGQDQNNQTSFDGSESSDKSIQAIILNDEEILDMRKQLILLRIKCEHIEAEYANKDMLIAELQAQLENCVSEDEFVKLRTKYDELKSECQRKEQSEKSSENHAIEELMKLKAKNDQLEAECKEKETAMARLKKELENVASEEELKELKTKNDELIAECEKNERSIAKLKEQLEENHTNKEDPLIIRAKYDQLEAEHEKKMISMKKLQEELGNHESELKELTIKCERLQAECKKKDILMEKLEEELKNVREINISSQKKSTEDLQTLEKALASAVAETEVAKKTLSDTNDLLISFENQISQCRNEHEPKIMKLEEELTKAKVRDETKSECIKVQTDKIAQVESAFTLETKKLEDKIGELSKSVERCQDEKKVLEQRLSKNLAEIEALDKRCQVAAKNEKEKDKEIEELQKALKKNLVGDVQDKKMEEAMKKTLKELNETKEALVRVEEIYERLRTTTTKELNARENEISELRQNAKLLETRRKEAEEAKEDIGRIKTENEELKSLIEEKDREMVSFMKNRDEMIAKFETLIKDQQEELERANREITRLQDNLHRKMPTTPRNKGTKSGEDSLKAPIPVVDISDSETKKTVTRTTRKKRLYQVPEDSCVDLEVSDNIPPTPSSSTSTRSLRTRRK